MGTPVTYLAGDAISFTVPLVDAAGVAFAASSATMRVLDGTGAVVTTGTLAVISPDATDVALGLAAEHTTLADGVQRDIREIELVCERVTGGRTLVSFTIGLERQDVLAVPSNSFMSMAEAQMLAYSIPGVDGWYAANRADRVRALIEAHYRLVRRRYRVLPDDNQRLIADFNNPGNLWTLTLEAFNVLDPRFARALKRAQLFEADAILDGSGVEQPDDGLVSKKVGESTETYRAVAHVTALTSRAMRELGPFLLTDVKVGRA